MTSLLTSIRQNGPQFHMPISSLVGVVYQYNPTAGSIQFSTAAWADGAGTAASLTVGLRGPPRYLSTINQAGAGLLRDLGKQVISAGRVFRKVQLVVRQTTSNSTFGVEGATLAPTQPNVDFLTGYIELGTTATGPATPIGQYGRL